MALENASLCASISRAPCLYILARASVIWFTVGTALGEFLLVGFSLGEKPIGRKEKACVGLFSGTESPLLEVESLKEADEDFLDPDADTLRVCQGNPSICRGEGVSSSSWPNLSHGWNEDSSSERSSKDGEKSLSSSEELPFCLSMMLSSAAVAGKSMLPARAFKDGMGGRLHTSSLGAGGASSGVTARCDVAGEMSRTTDVDGAAFGVNASPVDAVSDDGSLPSMGMCPALPSSSQQQHTAEQDVESVDTALCRLIRLRDGNESGNASSSARACWSRPTIEDKSS